MSDFIKNMGSRACLSGKTEKDCPFIEGSESAGHWLDGWRKTDFELRAAKRRH